MSGAWNLKGVLHQEARELCKVTGVIFRDEELKILIDLFLDHSESNIEILSQFLRFAINKVTLTRVPFNKELHKDLIDFTACTQLSSTVAEIRLRDDF